MGVDGGRQNYRHPVSEHRLRINKLTLSRGMRLGSLICKVLSDVVRNCKMLCAHKQRRGFVAG